MEHIDELNHKFSEAQEDLARIDFDHEYIEQKLVHSEKGTLSWFHFLEQINAIELKRKLVVGRLASLRIIIDREKKKLERHV